MRHEHRLRRQRLPPSSSQANAGGPLDGLDLPEAIRARTESPSVNVCSGKSPLGDLRVDAVRDLEPDILADMERLPLPDAAFETVLFDPPWKLNYFDRQRGFFECVRICRPNGRILFNARWLGESENTRIEEVVVRADDPWANVSTIAIHRKQPGQSTLGGGSE